MDVSFFVCKWVVFPTPDYAFFLTKLRGKFGTNVVTFPVPVELYIHDLLFRSYNVSSACDCCLGSFPAVCRSRVEVPPVETRVPTVKGVSCTTLTPSMGLSPEG